MYLVSVFRQGCLLFRAPPIPHQIRGDAKQVIARLMRIHRGRTGRQQAAISLLQKILSEICIAGYRDQISKQGFGGFAIELAEGGLIHGEGRIVLLSRSRCTENAELEVQNANVRFLCTLLIWRDQARLSLSRPKDFDK
jgi:hypothetical protein